VGIYDSSRTRVAPVFGRLQCFDPSGVQWLQGLLDVANSRGRSKPEAGTAPLRVAKWWPREAALAAPPTLLRWLLEHAEAPATEDGWGRGATTISQRRRLVDRDAATMAEALQSLERRSSPRAWYVLEGPTRPDVYLDTGEVVVVIEGKRTETEPTTSTAWMRVRHEMLRHLDAAWEHLGGRRLYGLFIVEAEDGEGSAATAPQGWQATVELATSDEIVKQSLPHRSAEERSAIAGALLGVTTWQAVCDEFQIPRAVLIPEVLDDRPVRRRSRKSLKVVVPIETGPS
jgi:hypothetical protein